MPLIIGYGSTEPVSRYVLALTVGHNIRLLLHIYIFFILPYRSFAPLNVLKKLAGVWITGGKNIMFNQERNSSDFSSSQVGELYSNLCKSKLNTSLDCKRRSTSKVSHCHLNSARSLKACTVTFLCPMRFDLYPLDSHICKFRVGSTNFDDKYMRFSGTNHTKYL